MYSKIYNKKRGDSKTMLSAYKILLICFKKYLTELKNDKNFKKCSSSNKYVKYIYQRQTLPKYKFLRRSFKKSGNFDIINTLEKIINRNIFYINFLEKINANTHLKSNKNLKKYLRSIKTLVNDAQNFLKNRNFKFKEKNTSNLQESIKNNLNNIRNYNINYILDLKKKKVEKKLNISSLLKKYLKDFFVLKNEKLSENDSLFKNKKLKIRKLTDNKFKKEKQYQMMSDLINFNTFVPQKFEFIVNIIQIITNENVIQTSLGNSSIIVTNSTASNSVQRPNYVNSSENSNRTHSSTSTSTQLLSTSVINLTTDNESLNLLSNTNNVSTITSICSANNVLNVNSNKICGSHVPVPASNNSTVKKNKINIINLSANKLCDSLVTSSQKNTTSNYSTSNIVNLSVNKISESVVSTPNIITNTSSNFKINNNVATLGNTKIFKLLNTTNANKNNSYNTSNANLTTSKINESLFHPSNINNDCSNVVSSSVNKDCELSSDASTINNVNMNRSNIKNLDKNKYGSLHPTSTSNNITLIHNFNSNKVTNSANNKMFESSISTSTNSNENTVLKLNARDLRNLNNNQIYEAFNPTSTANNLNIIYNCIANNKTNVTANKTHTTTPTSTIQTNYSINNISNNNRVFNLILPTNVNPIHNHEDSTNSNAKKDHLNTSIQSRSNINLTFSNTSNLYNNKVSKPLNQVPTDNNLKTNSSNTNIINSNKIYESFTPTSTTNGISNIDPSTNSKNVFSNSATFNSNNNSKPNSNAANSNNISHLLQLLTQNPPPTINPPMLSSNNQVTRIAPKRRPTISIIKQEIIRPANCPKVTKVLNPPKIVKTPKNKVISETKLENKNKNKKSIGKKKVDNPESKLALATDSKKVQKNKDCTRKNTKLNSGTNTKILNVDNPNGNNNNINKNCVHNNISNNYINTSNNLNNINTTNNLNNINTTNNLNNINTTNNLNNINTTNNLNNNITTIRIESSNNIPNISIPNNNVNISNKTETENLKPANLPINQILYIQSLLNQTVKSTNSDLKHVQFIYKAADGKTFYLTPVSSANKVTNSDQKTIPNQDLNSTITSLPLNIKLKTNTQTVVTLNETNLNLNNLNISKNNFPVFTQTKTSANILTTSQMPNKESLNKNSNISSAFMLPQFQHTFCRSVDTVSTPSVTTTVSTKILTPIPALAFTNTFNGTIPIPSLTKQNSSTNTIPFSGFMTANSSNIIPIQTSTSSNSSTIISIPSLVPNSSSNILSNLTLSKANASNNIPILNFAKSSSSGIIPISAVLATNSSNIKSIPNLATANSTGLVPIPTLTPNSSNGALFQRQVTSNSTGIIPIPTLTPNQTNGIMTIPALTPSISSGNNIFCIQIPNTNENLLNQSTNQKSQLNINQNSSNVLTPLRFTLPIIQNNNVKEDNMLPKSKLAPFLLKHQRFLIATTSKNSNSSNNSLNNNNNSENINKNNINNVSHCTNNNIDANNSSIINNKNNANNNSDKNFEGNSEISNVSSFTLEQLREFDKVMEKVIERSNGISNNKLEKIDNKNETSHNQNKLQVENENPQINQKLPSKAPNLASIDINPTDNEYKINVSNKIATVPSGPKLTIFVTNNPTIQGITSLTNISPSLPFKSVSINSTVNNSNINDENGTQQNKNKNKLVKTLPYIKPNLNPGKSQQRMQEDEHTQKRIYSILAEYAEHIRNSPDSNNKPAPRRRSNPTNLSPNAKRRKKSRRISDSQSYIYEEQKTLESEDSEITGTSISSPLNMNNESLGDDSSEILCLDDSNDNEKESNENLSTRMTQSSSVSQTPMNSTILKQIFVTDPNKGVLVPDSILNESLGPIKISNAILMPNYVLPMSNGQQIAFLPGNTKILTVKPLKINTNITPPQQINEIFISHSAPKLEYINNTQILNKSNQNNNLELNNEQNIIIQNKKIDAVTNTEIQEINLIDSDSCSEHDAEPINNLNEFISIIPQENDSQSEGPENISKKNKMTDDIGEIANEVLEQEGCSNKDINNKVNENEMSGLNLDQYSQKCLNNIGCKENTNNKQNNDENNDTNCNGTGNNIENDNDDSIKSLNPLKMEEKELKMYHGLWQNQHSESYLKVDSSIFRQSPGMQYSNLSRAVNNTEEKNDNAANNQKIYKICSNILESKLRKSLSEECQDLGMDEPSASDLFPGAADILLYDNPLLDFQEKKINSQSDNKTNPIKNDEIKKNVSLNLTKHTSDTENGYEVINLIDNDSENGESENKNLTEKQKYQTINLIDEEDSFISEKLIEKKDSDDSEKFKNNLSITSITNYKDKISLKNQTNEVNKIKKLNFDRQNLPFLPKNDLKLDGNASKNNNKDISYQNLEQNYYGCFNDSDSQEQTSKQNSPNSQVNDTSKNVIQPKKKRGRPKVELKKSTISKRETQLKKKNDETNFDDNDKLITSALNMYENEILDSLVLGPVSDSSLENFDSNSSSSPSLTQVFDLLLEPTAQANNFPRKRRLSTRETVKKKCKCCNSEDNLHQEKKKNMIFKKKL